MILIHVQQLGNDRDVRIVFDRAIGASVRLSCVCARSRFLSVSSLSRFLLPVGGLLCG
jgi:hypothetical protein